MRVRLGNPDPVDVPGPCVLILEHVPPDIVLGMHTPDLTARWRARRGSICSMGLGHGAFQTVLQVWTNGRHTRAENPAFVDVELDIRDIAAGLSSIHATELLRQLSEHFDCPPGVPEDLEARYYTENGPPGVGV